MFVYNTDKAALFKTINDFANVVCICYFQESKICELCRNKTKEIKLLK